MVKNIKKDLLDKIASKVKHKNALKNKIANENTRLETYVLDFIKNVENLSESLLLNKDLWVDIVEIDILALQMRIRTIDINAVIEVSWLGSEGRMPQVDRVLIKWSSEFQAAKGIDPELVIDATTLLFNFNEPHEE